MKHSTFFYSLFFSTFALNISASVDLSKNNPPNNKKSLNKGISVSKINDKSLVIVNKDTDVNENKMQKDIKNNPSHQIYQIKTEDGSNIIINFNPKINIANPYGNESSENNTKQDLDVSNASTPSINNANLNKKTPSRLIKNKYKNQNKGLAVKKKQKKTTRLKKNDKVKSEIVKENLPVEEKEEIDYVVRQVFVDEDGKTLETKEYQETDPEKIKQLLKEQNEGKAKESVEQQSKSNSEILNNANSSEKPETGNKADFVFLK